MAKSDHMEAVSNTKFCVKFWNNALHNAQHPKWPELTGYLAADFSFRGDASTGFLRITLLERSGNDAIDDSAAAQF